jgi:hypothetical protein
MNKGRVALIAIITASLVYFYNSTKKDVVESSDQKIVTNTELAKRSENAKKVESHGSEYTKKANSQTAYKVEEVSVPNDKHGRSLVDYAGLITEFGKKNVRVSDIVNRLEGLGLTPVVAKSSNESTGSMYTVRTKNSLPGARYFHAQLFTDENGNQFMQHMSFEYRPGEGAFAQGVATAIREFGLSKEPAVAKNGFYSWNTDDGYVIWVKQMTAEDLKDDPFNAYTKKDIGTIRIAKEIEIHGQGESDSHDHDHIHSHN